MYCGHNLTFARAMRAAPPHARCVAEPQRRPWWVQREATKGSPPAHRCQSEPRRSSFHRRRCSHHHARCAWRNVAAAAASTEPAARAADSLLETLRTAAGLPLSSAHAESEGETRTGVCSHGYGRHLGLTVRWRLAAAADGSMFEELSSPQLSFCWGYDARTDELWEVDHVGTGTTLQLDDREVVLLAGFVRSGFWLHPAAQRHVCVEHDTQLDDSMTADGVSDAEHVAEDVGALHATPVQPSRLPLCLTLRLRSGGRLKARLRVCPSTGRVLLLRLRVAGDVEAWVFGDWEQDTRLPGVVVHATSSGARDIYRTDGVRAAGALPASWFSPPSCCMTDLRGCTYDSSVPGLLRTERSRSGHLLVRVAFNGTDAGWCILDTGASGFVISKAAADAAGMDSFGEVFVAGVGSKVASRFRRCAELTVGPITFHSPLLLEMSLSGIVWGASGPCVGIVGYDLFRAAVVDIPPSPGTGVTVFNPITWQQPASAAPWRWVPVSMVANVPHAWARWHGVPGDGEAELLMLDTGAGGADAIFHARSVARLGLGTVGAYSGTSSIRGVSSSSTASEQKSGMSREASNPTQRRQLDWLELVHGPGREGEGSTPSGVRFDQVETLMLGTRGAFDLSEHMSGAVCMPLLARTRMVCDLYRRRIAFL